MFTGIVEETGRLVSVMQPGSGRLFEIEARISGELRVDQSVCTNGVCLTVVACNDRTFSVVAVDETLRKTTVGAFAAGQRLNLERAMQPTGRLDGHIVQGHVDNKGTIQQITSDGNSFLVQIGFDEAFRSFLIPVGSVAVDGISLTVARLEPRSFTVAIIPHTWEHTIASLWKTGTAVNLEFDMVGKYVVGWLESRQNASTGLTEDTIRAAGFGH